jgi:hypothetical protein
LQPQAGAGGITARAACCLTGDIALTRPVRPPCPLEHPPDGHSPFGNPCEGSTPMSKEKNKGNKETKKPKKEKVKVLATANSGGNNPKSATTIAGKKVQ